MSEWAAKRFWTDVTVEAEDGGFTVRLDGRAVKSPGKRGLVMPSREMADAMAAEWAAQGELIEPGTMPVTRSVNSALDQTGPARAGVIDMLAAYAETDLLCHRADGPAELVARQGASWDPLLAWAVAELQAPLEVSVGILPADQPADSLARFRDEIDAFGNFGLTGLYDLITLSGSAVIGLAVARNHIPAEAGWRHSRIDEDWQTELWGEDEEAAENAAASCRAFHHAARFLGWSGAA